MVSFDENQVVLDTDMGLLTMKGKDLHVSRLTLEKARWMWTGRLTAWCTPPMNPTASPANPCLTVCFGKEGP